MITIRNTTEKFGGPVEFTAELLVDAVADMQDAIRACGPEFAGAYVSPDDYEVVPDAVTEMTARDLIGRMSPTTLAGLIVDLDDFGCNDAAELEVMDLARQCLVAIVGDDEAAEMVAATN